MVVVAPLNSALIVRTGVTPVKLASAPHGRYDAGTTGAFLMLLARSGSRTNRLCR